MKTKSLLAIVAFFCHVITAMATILTVDNNPGSPAQFTTLQAAVSAASTDDTIHVAGAGAVYAAPTIDKKLTFIGAGKRFLLPGNTGSAVSQDIHLTAAASGTSFLGIQFNNLATNMVCDSAVSNISFLNCFIASGAAIRLGKGASGWLFEGCIFDNSYRVSATANSSFSNVVFQNNVFVNCGALETANFGTTTFDNVTIRNNIFYSNVTNMGAVWLTYAGWTNFTMQENIFFQTNCGYSGYNTTVTYLNNCSYLSTDNLGNTGSNSGNINSNPLFVNYPATGQAAWDPAYDFHLLSGSPCMGAGTSGGDIGLYGGNARFNASVLPPVPQITNFQIRNSTVPANGALQLDATIIDQH